MNSREKFEALAKELGMNVLPSTVADYIYQSMQTEVAHDWYMRAITTRNEEHDSLVARLETELEKLRNESEALTSFGTVDCADCHNPVILTEEFDGVDTVCDKCAHQSKKVRVLVPVEPTEKMLDSCNDGMRSANKRNYKAMITASKGD